MTSLADLYQRNRAGDLEAIPVQPEDTSSWWDRVKAAWASGGWQDPQPGQRGTFVPSRINEHGKAEPAVPGIIQQPAEGLYGLMTAPLSDIVRSGDRDAIRAASEASFDVASMLPAAGVAAGRTMPTNAAGMGGGKLDPPLPMDKASRMARAKEMGFNTDTTWYHGTAEKFDAFDPATIGDNFRADERGFFFSNVPSIADGYAMSDSVGLPREGGNVIPAHLRMENPLIVDEMRLNREGMHGVLGKTEDPIGFWDNYQGLLNKWADAQKADGIVIVDPSYKVPNGPNKGQSSMMAVSFDPSRIRSVNAAFDPAKKNSANLLASNPDDLNTSAILAAMQGQDKPSAGLAGAKPGTGAGAGRLAGAPEPIGQPSGRQASGLPGLAPDSSPGQPAQGPRATIESDPYLKAWADHLGLDYDGLLSPSIAQAAADGQFAYYGVRTTERPLTVGEPAKNSFVWDRDKPTKEELPGPSTVGLRLSEDGIEEARKHVYDYDGQNVSLIGSNYRMYGADDGEWILPGGQVVDAVVRPVSSDWRRVHKLFSNPDDINTAAILALLTQQEKPSAGLVGKAKGARPEPDALIPKAEAMGADVAPQGRSSGSVAETAGGDYNQFLSNLQDNPTSNPVVGMPTPGIDPARVRAEYEQALRRWHRAGQDVDPYGPLDGPLGEDLPAVMDAVRSAADAAGRKLHVKPRSLGSQYAYLETPATPGDGNWSVRIADHGNQSVHRGENDFNIAPGQMSVDEFLSLLPKIYSNTADPTTAAILALLTQQSQGDQPQQ